jgi:hypothetical protein
LPLPELPTSATVSPAAMSSETRSSAGRASACVGAAILEADLLQHHAALGAREHPGAGVGFGLGVDQAEHRVGGGQAALHRFVDLGQALDRRLQRHQRRHEGDEGARRQRAGLVAQQREVDHRRHRDPDQQHDDAGVERRRRRVLDGQLAVGLDHAVEAGLLILLAAENFHHALAADAFVEHIGQFAHGRLRAFAQVAHAPSGEGDDGGHQRQQAKAEHRQLPVGGEHGDQVADGEHRVAHGNVDDVEHRLGHLGGVEGHARERGAGRGLVEKAVRQAHDAGEHLLAQVGLHPAAEPCGAVLADKAGEHAHHRQAQDHRRDGPQRHARRIARQHVAEELLHGGEHAGGGRLGGAHAVRRRQRVDDDLQLADQQHVGGGGQADREQRDGGDPGIGAELVEQA